MQVLSNKFYKQKLCDRQSSYIGRDGNTKNIQTIGLP